MNSISNPTQKTNAERVSMCEEDSLQIDEDFAFARITIGFTTDEPFILLR